MTITRRHTLTFEGDVPEDEMQRAALLGHPKIREALEALEAAFAEVGLSHKATSKTIKTVAARTKPAAGRAARAAE